MLGAASVRETSASNSTAVASRMEVYAERTANVLVVKTMLKRRRAQRWINPSVQVMFLLRTETGNSQLVNTEVQSERREKSLDASVQRPNASSSTVLASKRGLFVMMVVSV